MTVTLAALGVALAFGWLLPTVGMRMLWPSIESSGRSAANYRGREVFLGLGIVWVFWAAGLRIAGPGTLERVFGVALPWADALAVAVTPVYRAVISVVWAFLFGLIDDVWGTSAEKGFSGHLRALLSGRLTTGALKLFGIGLVSLAAGFTIAEERASLAASAGSARIAVHVVTWFAAAAVVALSANLVNLLDLRPGRALKATGLFALLSAGAWALAVPAGPSKAAGVFLVTLAWMLGPLVAVWPLDLGERGMLGDAGANAAGVLVGSVLAWSLPLVGLVVVAVLLLGINLLSERISLSRIIEGSRVLRRLDDVGRAIRDVLEDDGTHSR